MVISKLFTEFIKTKPTQISKKQINDTFFARTFFLIQKKWHGPNLTSYSILMKKVGDLSLIQFNKTVSTQILKTIYIHAKEQWTICFLIIMIPFLQFWLNSGLYYKSDADLRSYKTPSNLTNYDIRKISHSSFDSL